MLCKGTPTLAPVRCTPHSPLLCSVMGCSSIKIIKRGELKARVERKRRKLIKLINPQQSVVCGLVSSLQESLQLYEDCNTDLGTWKGSSHPTLPCIEMRPLLGHKLRVECDSNCRVFGHPPTAAGNQRRHMCLRSGSWKPGGILWDFSNGHCTY